jgi:hypothetical protein
VLVPGDDARGGEPSRRTKDGLQCGARFVETTESLSNEVARHAATQIERELTQWGPAGGGEEGPELSAEQSIPSTQPTEEEAETGSPLTKRRKPIRVQMWLHSTRP